MDVKKLENQKVCVEFESHPPIDEDIEGIAVLLRQTLLHFANCDLLARHLVELRDITQIIAQESSDEDEDEPDNDIYGVCSVINLETNDADTKPYAEAKKGLIKFLGDKSVKFKSLVESVGPGCKIGFIINERYINLPAQLSLPTLKSLTPYLDRERFSYLVFVSKILFRSKNPDTQLPSKRTKSDNERTEEPLIYINPEEEIVFESCDHHSDFDISSYCDENATWAFGSDVKYIPHRRIMIVDYKKWPQLVRNLERELGTQS